jgi:hypothetical protein
MILKVISSLGFSSQEYINFFIPCHTYAREYHSHNSTLSCLNYWHDNYININTYKCMLYEVGSVKLCYGPSFTITLIQCWFFFSYKI